MAYPSYLFRIACFTLSLLPLALAEPGMFQMSGSSGVPAMHAALLPNGNVMFLDKIENYTELTLPNGQYAFASEYDPATLEVKPVSVVSNAFCCGGSFLADGRLITVGGNGPLSWLDPTLHDGFNSIRYLSVEEAAWQEHDNKLASRRWYASAQILADGSIFVVSGSLNGLDPMKNENNNPTYEVLDRNGASSGKNMPMDILVKNQPYFMYPFVHLLKDGNLFVFTAKSSQIFNVDKNQIVKELPDLAGLYRTYPNTGGSVLLPLSSKNNYEPEVMICGGGAFQDLDSPTDGSCGRIRPLSANPEWQMTEMPQGRCMVEGTLLLDGSVLWLNGAQVGAQGFGIAADPAFEALVYNPKEDSWTTSGRSPIARVYHSVALMLGDGSILVAGSNPNEMPILAADTDATIPSTAYPTEFRVEKYWPHYLMGDVERPQNLWVSTRTITGDFDIRFSTKSTTEPYEIVLYHGGFVTHALHMGQRMIYLDYELSKEKAVGDVQRLRVKLPESGKGVLPPGPYLLFVMVHGVPSIGESVLVNRN